MGCALDGLGSTVQFPVGARDCSLRVASAPAVGHLQPPPPGVKRPGREADQAPPSSGEVKNAWIYTSTPAHDIIVYVYVREVCIL
jgi:hypothetical protein